MEFTEVRELIRVRHELRRLVAAGRIEEARPLLDQMLMLASRDAAELADMMAELDRWEFSLGMGESSIGA